MFRPSALEARGRFWGKTIGMERLFVFQAQEVSPLKLIKKKGPSAHQLLFVDFSFHKDLHPKHCL